jgi:hypothetical protein
MQKIVASLDAIPIHMTTMDVWEWINIFWKLQQDAIAYATR